MTSQSCRLNEQQNLPLVYLYTWVSTGSPSLSLTSLLCKSVLPCMYCVRSTYKYGWRWTFNVVFLGQPISCDGIYIPL